MQTTWPPKGPHIGTGQPGGCLWATELLEGVCEKIAKTWPADPRGRGGEL